MKIHFIGIGGIGVSALANYYLQKGHRISGSDLADSEITQELKNKGAKILIGKHKKENLPKNADSVIYSPAVPKINPELKYAFKIQNSKFKIQVLSYPEALGELTKTHFTIAVSGTHGKSTTTAMIGLLLIKAEFDPTVIVGTKIKEFGDSNCRVGKSPYLVIEADEWQASFLKYCPRIIVLTNIEKEHLDYFRNLRHILKTYKDYIYRLSEKDWLVINQDDQNILKVIKAIKNESKIPNIQSYSRKQAEAKKIKKILKIPGFHNVYNGLAALTAARILKIPDKISFSSLSQYRGAWRRFELKKYEINGLEKKIDVISDYGHHPTEIKVTLKAAREKYPKKEIWCIFQPHQYQRTYYLFDYFTKVFRTAPINKIIITDIYDVAGRERKDIKKKISSEKLVKKVNKKNVIYLPKESILKYLKDNLSGKEIIIIMGAGNIYRLFDEKYLKYN